jgi:hypothetical protein
VAYQKGDKTMKIYETNRKQADAVFAILNLIIDDCNAETKEAEFLKDYYANGRENGYVLQLTYINGHYLFDDKKRVWIAFAENRNSDETVVYLDFGTWNGELTDKSYNEAKYFKFSELYKCAEYIKKQMVQAVKHATK